MTDLKPGLAINRHIRLVRPLGEGGMGAVWVADHLTLDTEVAVKLIHKKFGNDNPEVMRRFALEAQASAQLRSPHVVQIFDHGFMDDGTPYMVMELLEGENLGARLDRTGWLGFAQCAQVVRQVSKALARAHGAGIVHRDIKPDNIFLCPSEDGMFVKLFDFGIAKKSSLENDGLTNPGVMIGTAEYMSREQVMSAKDVDHHSDLWALAVVAYEMLTGDLPFTGESLGLLCVNICLGEFIPPSQLRKGVPLAVDEWFNKAFARNPADRFQSARELSKAFKPALLGPSLRAPQISHIEDEPSHDTPMPMFRENPTKVGLGSPPALVPLVPPPIDGLPTGETTGAERSTDVSMAMVPKGVAHRRTLFAVGAALVSALIALGAVLREPLATRAISPWGSAAPLVVAAPSAPAASPKGVVAEEPAAPPATSQASAPALPSPSASQSSSATPKRPTVVAPGATRPDYGF